MTLKKTNRGIVLAGVLIVGTFCYVLSENISFKSQADSIKSFAKKYVTECGNANAGELKDVSAKEEELIMSNYNDYELSDLMVEYGDRTNKTIALEYAQNLPTSYSIGTGDLGKVTECNTVVKNADVSKAGPTGAIVKLDCGMALTVKGTEANLFMCGYDNMITYDNAEVDELGNYVQSDIVFSQDINYSVEMFVEKVNDEWKIDYVSVSDLIFNEQELISGDDSSQTKDEESSSEKSQDSVTDIKAQEVTSDGE